MSLSAKLDSSTHEVGEPQNADVLLGRGKRAVNWEGNVRFRRLVKAWAGEYEKSTDPQKRDNIANRVMASIKESGGRFLQHEIGNDTPKVWVTISETTTRTKVKQALRDVTKMSRTKKKRPAVVALRPNATASIPDLEPRPIEEIVRSASTSHLVEPTRSLLLGHELLRRQQSMPSVEPLPVFPHAAPSVQLEPLPLHAPSSHQQLPEFNSILRRQQDILSLQLAARGNQSFSSAPPSHIDSQQQHHQALLMGVERLLHSSSMPSRSSIPPGSEDYMIGQAANSPAIVARRSTVLLDEAIQEQLNVDQMRRRRSLDEQSDLGSFLFEDDEDVNEVETNDRKPPANP